MSKAFVSGFIAGAILLMLIGSEVAGVELQQKNLEQKTIRVGTMTDASAQKKKITGKIIAYNVGLQISDNNCQQTLIVRTTNKNERYILVRYKNDCRRSISEQVIKKKRLLNFIVTRDSSECDMFIGDMIELSPTGEVTKLPTMKIIEGVKLEDIPTDKKLSCYSMQSYRSAQSVK